MPAHACARAPPLAAAAGRPGHGHRSGSSSSSGLSLGSGSGSLPGLILFESGLEVWAEPAPLPNRTGPAPLSGCEPVGLPTVANQLDCQRVQTSWTAKGCEPVGRPKVAMVGPLLECYIKHSKLSIETQLHTNYNTKSKHFSSLSLSSEHFNFSAF